MSEDLAGVLLLAYGGPREPAEIEPFLASVTGGRPLPPAVVAELRERYLRIGGRSPLPAVTAELATLLERRLLAEGARYRVAVGMLHWRPTIAAAVHELATGGVRRAVAITLVPQYAVGTVGRYLESLDRALAAAGNPFAVAAVESWGAHPLLIEAFAQKVEAALAALPTGEATSVVFTAHSLPLAMAQADVRFAAELQATAAAVAQRVGLAAWRLAYQSAGRGGGPWLGPSLGETVAELAAGGANSVLVVPLHFLADNVEILYDVDVVQRAEAERLGVRLVRTESLNTSPLLVAALADLAQRHLPRAATR